MPLLTSFVCIPLDELDVGDQIGQRVLVKDENDVLTDTASVTLQVQKPDGTSVAASATHEGVGVWLFMLPVFDQSGIWRWKTQTTGLINQVEQGKFRVHPLSF